MALLPLDQLNERAQTLYRAESTTRAKEQYRDQVLAGRHTLEVPPAVLASGRAYPIKTRVLEAKFRIVKTLLRDKDGPRVSVTDFGATAKAERERTTVQEWDQGLLATQFQLNPDLEAETDHDLIANARCAWLVLPKPEAWNDEPALDDDDNEDEDGESDDDDEGPEAWRARKEWTRQQQQRYRVLNPPIWWRFVPGQSMILLPDARGGLAEAYIYDQMPVRQVLDTWTHPDGSPIAADLAASVDRGDLTDRDRVNVVTRLDKACWQVAVLALHLEQRETEPSDVRVHGVRDELLYEGEHGLDEVPLALFTGDVTSSTDPVLHYVGFFDPVIGLQVLLDELTTARASVARATAYQTYQYVLPPDAAETPPAAAGAGDSPPDFEFVEGGVITGLRPGAKIEPLHLIDPTSLQHVRDFSGEVRAAINWMTIPDTTSGEAGADSGYLYAQVQAAAESNLEPFKRGKERGLAHALRLSRKCAAYLMRRGLDPIPVRYTADDGVRAVALTQELAERDWDERVSVRVQAVGGEMALVQTLQAAEQAGYITHLEAMERFGQRNPQRTLAKQIEERILQAPQLYEMLVAAVQQRSLAAISQGAAARVPGQPVIPEALAQITQSPDLIARLPETAGLGAQGGLPSPAAGNMAPPPPGLSDAQAFRVQTGAAPGGGPGGIGGGVTGQAQAAPGGFRRQAHLNQIGAA